MQLTTKHSTCVILTNDRSMTAQMIIMLAVLPLDQAVVYDGW